MAALLVRDAGQFDVIVSTNMFGDILSDEASESPAAWGWRRPSTPATRTRGAGPARLGARHRRQSVANPSSLIGSAAMLLAWLGERRSEDRLVKAAQSHRKRAG